MENFCQTYGKENNMYSIKHKDTKVFAHMGTAPL